MVIVQRNSPWMLRLTEYHKWFYRNRPCLFKIPSNWSSSDRDKLWFIWTMNTEHFFDKSNSLHLFLLHGKYFIQNETKGVSTIESHTKMVQKWEWVEVIVWNVYELSKVCLYAATKKKKKSYIYFFYCPNAVHWVQYSFCYRFQMN